LKCRYFSIITPTISKLWCGVVYCNILSFIVNALVLLTRKVFLIFVCSMYCKMARMQTNVMKATLAVCYVPAIYYDYSSNLIGWHPHYSAVSLFPKLIIPIFQETNV